jgi:mannitol 2-dehydrogenase
MADWVAGNVAFPNGMVDCITPATGDRERALVRDTFGIEDASPVMCEPFRQWVLEDRFPLGRPALEKVGVEFVTDVAPYELMKLRILNGGHAAIAYPAGLMGIHFVHEAMAEPLVSGFLQKLEQDEIIPVVPQVPGVDLGDYFNLVKDRFANPKVGDTVARLCLDGSNRQPKFILPSVADRLAAGLPVDGLALEVALWCRYCAGTTETGDPIMIDDIAAERLNERALAARNNPQAWLGMADIFGTLGDSAEFAAAFAIALEALWSHGTRRTLETYLDSGRADAG